MLSKMRIAALVLLVVASGSLRAEPPLRVVTSIKPLQLVAIAVGGSEVQVDALLDPRASPHDYQLRPSDRSRLDTAAVVFWIGPQLEHFLQPALKILPAATRVIALQDSVPDPHLWMDPLAVQAAAQRIVAVYSELRPARAAYFQANAARLQADLQREDQRLHQLFAGTAQRGYMVEHDAYGRFESRYGLAHLVALTDRADLPPSVAAMVRIRQQLDNGQIGCVLAEAQQSVQLQALLDGRSVRVVRLDPLAANIPVSEKALPVFYRQLGDSIAGCLRR